MSSADDCRFRERTKPAMVPEDKTKIMPGADVTSLNAWISSAIKKFEFRNEFSCSLRGRVVVYRTVCMRTCTALLSGGRQGMFYSLIKGL